ncbi:MAG: hypothetical protein QXX12_01800 [Nanopusillaceae archaeon]
MAKTMKALKEKTEDKKGNFITIKVGSQSFSIENAVMAETLLRAYRLKKEIEALEPTFQELKNQIINFARTFLGDHGSITFTVPLSPEEGGKLEVKLTFQYEAIIDSEHISEVKRILGDQFSSLVRTKVKYVGTKRLLELLHTGDPSLESILPYVAVKEFGRSLQFKVK